MNVDLASIALKACSYLAVLQAAGAALFLLLFGRTLDASTQVIRRLGLACALLGIACVLAFQAFEAARMAGEVAGLEDGQLQWLAATSRMGGANALRLAGLGLLAAAFAGRRARHGAFLLSGAVAALAAFACVGHTTVHPWRWLLAPLLGVHVLVAAFWFGSLLPLACASGCESAGVGRAVVQRFSALAGRLVPLLALAAIALAAALTGNHYADTSYLRALLLKLAGLAVLLGIAAVNRWRLGPAIGRSPGATRAFQRSLLAEYLLMGAVIALTATLTTLWSPEP